MTNIFQFQGQQSHHVIYRKYELKINHLNELNMKLTNQNIELKRLVKQKQYLNEQIINSKYSHQINSILEQQNKRLSDDVNKLKDENEKLMTMILLNEQISNELKKQCQFNMHRYERKIIQLRQNLQQKQVQIQTIQQKYDKFKPLITPAGQVNIHKLTNQIFKYQKLCDQLLNQRNKKKISDSEQIITFLKNYHKIINTSMNQISYTLNNLKNKNKSNQISMMYNATDIRSKISNQFNKQDQYYVDFQGMDIYLLRLYIELRELKVKYKQRMSEILEYRQKDKIMKQGYHTITKQMQKVKNQNCQLKIKLEHLEKKVIKTVQKIQSNKTLTSMGTKLTISNLKSVINSQSQPQPQSQPQTQTSIQNNNNDMSLSNNKSLLRTVMTAETRNGENTLENKSHFYDQKIQNIEEILSFENIGEKNNWQKVRKNNNNKINNDVITEESALNNSLQENLQVEKQTCQMQSSIVCQQQQEQQNQNDLSISLDTSGFLPVKFQRSIDDNIILGLIDVDDKGEGDCL